MTSAQTVQPLAAPPPKHLSPYYRDYLNEQASSIRAKYGDDGSNPTVTTIANTAVRQFLEYDLQRPLSNLPAVPLDALENIDPDVPDNLRGISMGLVQGATFGWGDEAVGATLGLLTGVGARAGIEDYRIEYGEWAREHGGLAFAAEIAGGFTTGGVGGVGKGAAALIGRGATLGALAGAGASKALPDDLSPDALWDATTERFKGAFVGAATGVVLGTVSAALGTFIKPIVSTVAGKVTTSDTFGRVARATSETPILNRLESMTPEGRGRELIGQWMQQKGVTPAQALKNAQGHWVNGQRASIIDILGDDFQAFAASVLKQRNPSAIATLKLLTERQEAQGGRLVGQLAFRIMRNPKLGTANVYKAAADLEAQASAAAEPHFKKAYTQVVRTTPEMLRIMLKGDFRAAWNAAAKVANAELEEGLAQGLKMPLLPSISDVSRRAAERAKSLKLGNHIGYVDQILPEIKLVPDELPARGIHYLQRYLQEPVMARHTKLGAQVTRETQKLIDNELKVIQTRYKSLTREAITQVPDLGRGLAAYSGPLASRDAMAAGFKRFMTNTANGHDVMKDIKRIKHPGDRDFYRLGAIKAFYEQIARSNDPKFNAAQKLFSGDLFRATTGGGVAGRLDNTTSRWLALFYDGSRAGRPQRLQASKDFIRLLMGEANFSKTAGVALSLPSKVNAQRVVEGGVTEFSPVSASASVALLRAGRQAFVKDAQQLSQPELRALAELFGEGLRNPAHLRALLEDIAYDMKRKVLNIGTRAGASVMQKAARAVTGAF